MVGAIKVLETSHIVFVDDLLKNLLTYLTGNAQTAERFIGSEESGLLCANTPYSNVIIIQVGTHLPSKLSPRLTDICSLENIKHFLLCGSLSSFLSEYTPEAFPCMNQSLRNKPDYPCVKSLSI